jgi:mRNA interferase MazF
MLKDFLSWFRLKPKIDQKIKSPLFQEREIWWCSVGVNIGCETDGKNGLFERPVLIFKKYNHNQFLGFPMTTANKTGKFYSNISTQKQESRVMLSQLRVFDSKRLIRKMTKLTSLEFEKVKKDWVNSME